MKMTPLDIQQQQFKTRFRGFDVREVDTFLEQTAGAFEALQRENEEYQEDSFVLSEADEVVIIPPVSGG